MKIKILIVLSFIVNSATAQIAFHTGSVQLDADLNSINVQASADFQTYRDDLHVSYHISEQKIDYMRASLNMAPGEIYLALEIARLSNTPIDEVNRVYKMNRNKGWGQISKELGIKPGSAEFHQLKNNTSKVKNRGNGKNKGKGNGKGKK